jgi:hypothetical protein
MSIQYKVIGGASVTPMMVAELFWEMNSEEQADFFAYLERIAGYKLCIQMAAAADEMRLRSERGDHDAQNGFQTMLAHAQEYVRDGIESRCWREKYAIQDMVAAAQGGKSDG